MVNLKNCGPYRRKGIESYSAYMSNDVTNPAYDSTVTYLLKQSGYTIEEDPANLRNHKALYEALERFCKPEKIIDGTDPYFCAGLRAAYKAFARDGKYLTPLQSEEELYAHVNLDKSAGIYFKKKGEAWDQAYNDYLRAINGEISLKPCLAGARTQRGNKTRLTWNYPLDAIILETKYGKPLINKFRNMNTPLPYCQKRATLGVRTHWALTERNIVELDYSSFDSTIPTFLILKAFNILGTWFDFSPEEYKEWRLIEYYFTHTPIVMPDGNLYRGKNHGVPSGSLFTNIIDSIVNYIILVAIMEKFSLNFHSKKVFVCGDDSIFTTNKDVNLHDIANYAIRFGLKLKLSKSKVRSKHEPYHYLGFDWDRKTGMPLKEEVDAIKSMTQPERWRPRGKTREAEKRRAYELIHNMCALGENLYEIWLKFQWNLHPEESNHFFINLRSGDTSDITDYGSDYLNFKFSMVKPNRNRPICIPTLLLN